MSTTPTHCLECNAPLGPAEPHGLCARCLLKLGFASKLGQPSIVAAGQRMPIPPPLLPFDFGSYRVLRLLGRGGMGAVYEAEDLESGRRVALKVLGQTLDSVEMRKRFLREGRLAASVCHPNTVYIYGTEEIDGVPVIAMELAAGGTLRDLLKKEGPLPVKEAVDAILQVISGLEAAHEGGVLHRDVKPANCFVTPEGTVKVGDFGLSVSTLARADSQLTASGMMLGTPSYAPPEQLRGDELDVRADIYSVGATLYTLLTGKAPFDGENAVQVVAAVLDKAPVAITDVRPDVPTGLSQLVARCLAKKREDRHATYAALREALLVFSSETPEPAPLGLRFIASIMDEGCAILPWFVYLLIAGQDLPTQWLSIRDGFLWSLMMMFLVWRMAYYTVAEGLWGAGVGKALCGLLVVRPGRGAAGLGRAAGRVLIFMTAELMGYFGQLLLTSPEAYRAGVRDEKWMLVDWAWLLFVFLFVTMRRRNGWAAVHDLATGTRVVQRAVDRSRPRVEVAINGTETTATGQLGPFNLLDSLPLNGWRLGFDELLRRRVWIRQANEGEPSVSETRRELSRATRLRWLAGMHGLGGRWNAYQAPSGQSLSAFAPGSQPWAAVRHWLADLTDEVSAASEDGTLPARVSIGHLWVTAEGRLVLLDEPVGSLSPEVESGYDVRDAHGLQKLLTEVTNRVLNLSALSLPAGEFLHRLAAGSFDRVSFIAGNLQSLLNKPAELTRRRRLASLVFAPAICILISGVITVLMVREWLGGDVKFRAANPEQSQLIDAVRLYAEAKGREVSTIQYLGASGIANAQFADSIGQWTAYRFGDFIRDPGFEEAARNLKRSERKLAREIARDYPGVTKDQFIAIDSVVRAAVAAMDWYSRMAIFGFGPGILAVFLIAIGTVNLISVAAFRTSFGLRLFGLAVVDQAGARVSRGRHLWRNALVSAPFAVSIGLTAVVSEIEGKSNAIVGFAGACAVIGVLLGGVLILSAIIRPNGGWYDRLAGTRVVLR